MNSAKHCDVIHAKYYDSVRVRGDTHLYVQNRKNANFISQHAFCPVFIHPPDHCQYFILNKRDSSGLIHDTQHKYVDT